MTDYYMESSETFGGQEATPRVSQIDPSDYSYYVDPAPTGTVTVAGKEIAVTVMSPEEAVAKKQYHISKIYQQVAPGVWHRIEPEAWAGQIRPSGKLEEHLKREGYEVEYKKEEKAFEYKPVEKPKTFLQKVAQKVFPFTPEEAEARRIKQIKEAEEKTKELRESFFFFRKPVRLAPKIQEQIYERGRGISYGLIKGIREKPTKTAILTGVFFIAPGVIAGVGKGAVALRIPKLLTITPTVAKITGITAKGIKYGLPVVYGTSVVWRAEKEPTPFKAGIKYGEILGTEIAPMVVGGVAGAEFWPRVGTWLRPGGKRLPKEKIFPKDYLKKVKEGKITIPKEPVKKHLELFVSKKYAPPGTEKPIGYHLTAGKMLGVYRTPTGELRYRVLSTLELKKLGLLTKVREAEALYVAPYPSVHFARISPVDLKLYGGELFKPYTLPRGLIVEPKGFKVAGIVSKKIQVKLGWAGVPGSIIGKAEPQALIPPGSEFIFTKEKFHFWLKGYKIIMPKIKAIGKLSIAKETLVKALYKKQFEKIISSYIPGKAYITTPSSLAIATSISLKSVMSKQSKLISKISSKILSLMPSVLPKYAPPSIPSYAPPSYPPSIPSYAPPSYPPSILPPSIPSYAPPSYPPSYPPITRPPVIPPLPPIILFRKRKKVLKLLVKGKYKQLYLPGFTAKMLGIQRKISQKVARKLLKVEFTGLEIRPSVKVLK